MKGINLIGLKFGRLLVISRDQNGKCGRWRWLCKCDCGNKVVHFSTNLRTGRCSSCGCLKKEKCKKNATTHGQSRTKLYNVWSSMIDRCENINSKHYINYGGRGISVCKTWRSNFEIFLKDMGTPKPGLTLDRINNNGNYSFKNCRWATRTVQNNNRRNNKGVNIQ